jgi:hypothetical protein
MKITMIVLALTLLAGCAIIPLAPYDAYGPGYPSSYYASTENEYYSYDYYTPRYSGYYGSPYPGYHGYGHGYYRPRYYGNHGGRGYGYRGGYGYHT